MSAQAVEGTRIQEKARQTVEDLQRKQLEAEAQAHQGASADNARAAFDAEERATATAAPLPSVTVHASSAPSATTASRTSAPVANVSAALAPGVGATSASVPVVAPGRGKAQPEIDVRYTLPAASRAAVGGGGARNVSVGVAVADAAPSFQLNHSATVRRTHCL